MTVVARTSLRTKALVVQVLFAMLIALLSWQAVVGYNSDLLRQRKATLRAVSQSAMSTLAFLAAAGRRGEMTHSAP